MSHFVITVNPEKEFSSRSHICRLLSRISIFCFNLQRWKFFCRSPCLRWFLIESPVLPKKTSDKTRVCVCDKASQHCKFIHGESENLWAGEKRTNPHFYQYRCAVQGIIWGSDPFPDPDRDVKPKELGTQIRENYYSTNIVIVYICDRVMNDDFYSYLYYISQKVNWIIQLSLFLVFAKTFLE